MRIESNTSLKSTVTKSDLQEMIMKEAESKGMDVTALDWKVSKSADGKVTKLEAALTGTPNKNFKKGA